MISATDREGDYAHEGASESEIRQSRKADESCEQIPRRELRAFKAA
jgi:hypothetical protein